jgi:hypothetical protein
MKFLKEFSSWNPVLNKEVLDFIETNKTRLLHLWDKEKSEEENMEFLTNYFTEYPELMKSDINISNIKIPNTDKGIRRYAPVLQNIGGVKDFRSF